MPSKEVDLPLAGNQTGVADTKEFPVAQGGKGGSMPPCVPGPSCLPPAPPPCRGCQPTCGPRPCRGGS